MAASLYNRTLTDAFNVAGDIGSGFDAGVTARLVTSAYSFVATHTTNANLTGLLGSAVALTGLASSIVGNFYVLTSNAVTFTSVAGGSTAEAIVLYQTTGGGLILFQDSISVVTNGGNITVTPNVNGWFRIPIA